MNIEHEWSLLLFVLYARRVYGGMSSTYELINKQAQVVYGLARDCS